MCSTFAFLGFDLATALTKKYVVPGPGQQRLDAWQLFMDEEKTPQKCANCVFVISKCLNKWVSPVPEWLKYLDEESFFDTLDDFARISHTKEHHETAGESCEDRFCPVVEDPTALSPAEFREIDEWYVAMREATAPKDAFKKFVHALAADVNSKIGKQLLSDMTHDFLCYPASRINGPTPSEFLHNLRHPRFTGEEHKKGDGPMKIEFEKLVAILRGDKMKQLKPDVCAMIRLASMIPNDDTVLLREVSAARVAPIANETTLKGHDAGLLFPGLYVPKVDEDRDPKGSSSSVTETLISLFKHLPITDDAIWFETREEYLAFFRWQIEHKLQDEFYFPRWLSRLNGTDGTTALMEEIGDLVANQFRFRGDRQRIFESTSDVTLADRAFYGAGVKSLTRVKLPGDASYGYLVSPKYYATPAEQEFFRNKAMPTKQDLLRLATVAWGQPVEDLDLLRDKVVQIDYTIASHWQYRDAFEQNGAILYLDAEKRTPMGIWLSCREELVLPNGGQLWEHAKFIYRSTEIVVAAMM
jgi:hypothetical protein